MKLSRVLGLGFLGLGLAVPFSNAARAAENEEEHIRKAIAWAEPVLGKTCDFERQKRGDFSGSRYFEIRYRDKGQDQDSPDTVYPLTQLYCTSGAYNEVFVYLTWDSYAEGFRLLSFAEPKADYDYTDENFTRLKAPPKVIGYVARTELINADFDPDTKTISMSAKWRGLGDAWSSGAWEFSEGEFALKEFNIDPTYDLNAPGARDDSPDQWQNYQIYPEVRLNAE